MFPFFHIHFKDVTVQGCIFLQQLCWSLHTKCIQANYTPFCLHGICCVGAYSAYNLRHCLRLCEWDWNPNFGYCLSSRLMDSFFNIYLLIKCQVKYWNIGVVSYRLGGIHSCLFSSPLLVHRTCNGYSCMIFGRCSCYVIGFFKLVGSICM